MDLHSPELFAALLAVAVIVFAAHWHLKRKLESGTVAGLTKAAGAAMDEAERLVKAQTAAIADDTRARDANQARVDDMRKRLAGLGAPGG